MAKLSIEYGKIKKDGSRSVMIRLVSGKTQKHIPTQVVLKKSDYKEYRDGRIKVTNNSKYFDIEDYLSSLQTKVNEVMRNNYGLSLTAEQIANYIFRPTRNEVRKKNFFDFAFDFIKTSGKKDKNNYQCALRNLQRFIKSTYLPFADMNVELLTRWCNSLKHTKRAQSQYLAAIRHIYNNAALQYNTDDDIILSPYLFVRFKVPKQRPAGQRALSIEQLKEFFAHEPQTINGKLAKDCALLSICLCGTNLIDLYNATCYDGEYFKYERTKTKDARADNAHIEILVDERIKPLFEKYRDKKGAKVFNFGTHASYACFYKSVLAGMLSLKNELGFDMLQFYQFRHNMATIARNELGIDKATVDEMLNHVGSNRIADIYIKKDYRQINIANKKVVDYVFENIINPQYRCQ
ncbi:phage integrase SAM-like domain-containing protein [Ruminococcus sp.]|uniref:phage integrase SAM-like domain-containing protein n=1 Tax=Ruminococcus sp. TaxID=41978 RepID=UPI003F05A016